MSDAAADPFVRRLREQISALDRMLVETVNARLELVARLKLYKEEHGYSFNDPQREERLLEEVVRANSGPLSEDAVRELHSHVLDLCKREVVREEVEVR